MYLEIIIKSTLISQCRNENFPGWLKRLDRIHCGCAKSIMRTLPSCITSRAPGYEERSTYSPLYRALHGNQLDRLHTLRPKLRVELSSTPVSFLNNRSVKHRTTVAGCLCFLALRSRFKV